MLEILAEASSTDFYRFIVGQRLAATAETFHPIEAFHLHASHHHTADHADIHPTNHLSYARGNRFEPGQLAEKTTPKNQATDFIIHQISRDLEEGRYILQNNAHPLQSLRHQ